MRYLSLTLPGQTPVAISNPPGLKAEFVDLASFLSPFLNIIFYIAAFLAFYYLIWGSFQYILAKGEKEGLAKARARMTWAMVGLVVVFSAYFIAKFGFEIFPSRGGAPF